MKAFYYLLPAMLIVLTGCKSTPIPKPTKPPVQEFVNVPIALAGTEIPSDSQEKYRSNSRVKSYSIGRYVDPNNSKIMNESHTLYREVQQPQWNLAPQPDAQPLAIEEKKRTRTLTNPVWGQLENALNQVKTERENVKKATAIITENEKTIKLLVKNLKELKKQNQRIHQNTTLLKTLIEENQRKLKLLENVKEATTTKLEIDQ